MRKVLEEYILYLHNEQKASKNTELAYNRDLKKLILYLEANGIASVGSIKETDVEQFMKSLYDSGLSDSTLNRTIAAIKAFDIFCVKKGYSKKIVTNKLKTVNLEVEKPEPLSDEEINKIMKATSGDKPKEIRDRAIISLMLHEGLKVAELIELEKESFNSENYTIKCGKGKSERIVELSEISSKAMDNYLDNSREILVLDSDDKTLFVNAHGVKISRQGIWKMLKSYRACSGIKSELNPNKLRHTCAVSDLKSGMSLEDVINKIGIGEGSAKKLYT